MTESSRNTPIGAMAIGVLIVCLYGATLAAIAGGWWWLTWIVLVPLAASLIYGINESFQKVPRDAKGNRI